MLVIYLAKGGSVEIASAEKVESEMIFISSHYNGDFGLICKDTAGTTVAEFKVHDISGYAILPDPGKTASV